MRWIYGVAAGVLALLPVGLQAQQKNVPASEVDFALTYSAQHNGTTASNSFWAQGGSAELMATFYHGLGIAANVTGSHAGNINASGVGLTMVTTTFGPTYTWAMHRRGKSQRQWKLFGESLIGVANGTDSVFPSLSGASHDASSFALQLGGGADLALSRHFAVRLVQADWLRTQLPNGGTNVQNTLQLGAGVVFRTR